MSSIALAFGLTLIAGLTTGIGALLAAMIKKLNLQYLTWGLGISAGVMLFQMIVI